MIGSWPGAASCAAPLRHRRRARPRSGLRMRAVRAHLPAYPQQQDAAGEQQANDLHQLRVATANRMRSSVAAAMRSGSPCRVASRAARGGKTDDDGVVAASTRSIATTAATRSAYRAREIRTWVCSLVVWEWIVSTPLAVAARERQIRHDADPRRRSMRATPTWFQSDIAACGCQRGPAWDLRLPKRDEIGSNRHRALASCLSMISSQNRFTFSGSC